MSGPDDKDKCCQKITKDPGTYCQLNSNVCHGYPNVPCTSTCPSTQKYSCQNDQCVKDNGGKYTSLAACEAACKSVQHYSCIDGKCEPDPTGSYTDPTCNGQCGTPPPSPPHPHPPTLKYSCQNGSCVATANGEFCNKAACEAHCSPTPPPPPSPNGAKYWENFCAKQAEATSCNYDKSKGIWCEEGKCFGCPNIKCGKWKCDGGKCVMTTPDDPAGKEWGDGQCCFGCGGCGSAPLVKPLPSLTKPTNMGPSTLPTTIEGKPFPPPPVQKPPSHAGRPFRMTLWHEGVNNSVQSDPDKCTTYVANMIRFVKDKQFDRVFLQAGDPSQIKFGKPLFAYAQPEFIVDNYLAKLPSYTEAGLLIVVNPMYPWTFKSSVPGGIRYNNPGYKNSIPQTPDGGKYAQPYRFCNGGDDMCYNPPGTKSKDRMTCSNVKYECEKGKKCCIQFNKGAPNNLEQAFLYVNTINDLAEKKGIDKKITTIAFDGEDLGLYGSGTYAMAQAWQAARTHAPDVVEIGVAHGATTTSEAIGSNAAYPELYWIGELQYSGPPCKMCKSPATMGVDTCNNCKDKIYQQYLNNPKCMVEAFKFYLGDKSAMDSSCEPRKYPTPAQPGTNIETLAKSPGTCPLLSIEHAHFSPGDKNESTCVQKTPVSGMNDKAGICGTFDGFGNWDWYKFEKFMTLLAQKYELKDIGVYEYQFVPPEWMPGGQFIGDVNGGNGGHGNGNKKTNLWVPIGITIGVFVGIAILIIIIYFSFFRPKQNSPSSTSSGTVNNGSSNGKDFRSL